MHDDSTLTLYHLSLCPFCVRVRRAARQLGIELKLVDLAEDPSARPYLLRERGRATVPVLGIPTDEGERLLGESRDIIAFLERLHTGAQAEGRPQ